MVFTSDPAATAHRIDALDRYMAETVVDSASFRCAAYQACRASHPGKFFEGQLHHVGAHYDLALNGRPFRIVVVGQEYGNGPARVSRETRSHDVIILTGQRRRFTTDGQYPARNPHMRGTTSLLRLLFGRLPGTDYTGELLALGGSSVHVFEAFALTNFLLCSAIDADESGVGSKRGKSTATMQRQCACHFAAAMKILEPTVVVAQGKGVRKWMSIVIDHAMPISENLERVRIGDHGCLVATFTHPSVPSAMNWGTDARRPYLLEVVAPTVNAIQRQVASA
jgi:hypothetical protein